MKLIDLIDDREVKKWVLIFCILGVSVLVLKESIKI
mgnify:FL=1